MFQERYLLLSKIKKLHTANLHVIFYTVSTPFPTTNSSSTCFTPTHTTSHLNENLNLNDNDHTSLDLELNKGRYCVDRDPVRPVFTNKKFTCECLPGYEMDSSGENCLTLECSSKFITSNHTGSSELLMLPSKINQTFLSNKLRYDDFGVILPAKNNYFFSFDIS